VGGAAQLALYVAAEYLPVVATMRRPEVADRGRRAPLATAVALLVVGVPTLLQLTVAPGLLGHLERDRDAILDGQVWRLLTSLVVQDGGTGGAIANLVALAVVGAVAEQVWDRRRWAAIALGGAVAGELWGLVVQPVGGGNSVAVFALAASLAVAAILAPGSDRIAKALAVAALGAAAILVAAADIHGGAALAGALIALRFATKEPT
jgi:membrane associated rhomboid family serine protease